MMAELFVAGLDVRRAQLKRAHPRARAAQIDRLLTEWLGRRPLPDNGLVVLVDPPPEWLAPSSVRRRLSATRRSHTRSSAASPSVRGASLVSLLTSTSPSPSRRRKRTASSTR